MKNKGLIIALAIFICNVGVSQNISNLKFIHHSTTHGLSQNKVLAITQDSMGYMWFGTEAELNKFNGYSYEHYSTNKTTDSLYLLTNHLQSLETDLYGNIWFGTENGGLQKFDLNREKSHHYLLKKAPKNIDSLLWNNFDDTHDITKDEQGNLYGLSNNSLLFFNIENSKYELFQWADTTGTVNDFNSLLIDDKNRIWISTEYGRLAQFENGRFIDHTQYINGENRVSKIYDLEYDGNGNLLIGTLQSGIVKYNPDKKSIKTIEVPDRINYAKQNVRISKILKIKDQFWVGTWGHGIYIFNESLSNFRQFRNDENYDDSLADNYIFEIYQDREKNIWIGTANGVDLVSETPVIQIKKNGKKSLKDNEILSLSEGKYGNIWIGTRDGGLNMLNIFTGETEFYSKENILSDNTIESIEKDDNGSFWIGTRNGLNILDPESSKNRVFKHKKDNPNSLCYDVINYIMKDSKGHFWIGSDGGGVSEVDPETMNFKNYYAVTGQPNSLSNNTVRVIHEDHLNNIWIGTYFGLNKLKDDKDSFEVYFADINDPHSLQKSGVVSMLTDSKNRLWIGTYGGGLHLYDYEKDQFTYLEKDDGIAGNFIYGILEDENHNIWISTESGVSKIYMKGNDLNDAVIYSFRKEDGFTSSSFTYASHYSKDLGIMFLGTKEGLNFFNPEKLESRPFRPDIKITDLNILNRKVNVGDDFKILDRPLSEKSEIDIPYSYNMFTLNFIGLEYFTSGNIKYAYKLEPLMEEWSPYSNIRFATFTNLQPGTYTFRVRVTNNDKSSGEVFSKSLAINIVPPFWKTIWFKILVVVFIVLLLYGGYWLRSRALIRQKELLEQNVQKRTKELREAITKLQEQREEIETQNEELSSQFEEILVHKDQIEIINEELNKAQTELKTINEELDERVKERTLELVKTNQELDRFVYSASHDLSAPLKSILGLVNLAKFENKDETLNDHLNHMEKSVRKLEKVIKSLTQFSRNIGHQVKFKNIIFEEAVTEVLDEQQVSVKSDSVKIVRNYSEGDIIKIDFLRLKIVLSNLISNALKYRCPNRKTIITISFQITDKQYLISVKDNGMGIEPKSLKKVFDMFYRASDSSDGSGLGLYIVKETITKLKGDISLDSKLGEYTCFNISIPRAC